MALNNKRFRSLATRLSLGIIFLGTAVFITVLTANYLLSRSLLEEYVSHLARSTAASTVREIATVFSSTASAADSLATIVTRADINEEQIKGSIRALMKTNQDIFGMTVALEPHVLHQDIGEFSPYFFRDNGGVGYADLAAEDYRYLLWDWYNLPKATSRPVWTEPYYDEGGGNALMTTYATPLKRRNDGLFAGVATADIALDWLQQLTENTRILDTGFGLIVSKQDIVVAHPDSSRVMKKLKSMLKSDFIENYWDVYLQSKEAHAATYFNAPCRHTRGDCWIAIEPLLDTGWKVVIVIPESELIADIILLTGEIALLAVLGLSILVLAVVATTRKLIHPLGRLARVTADIGNGNLDISLPEPERNDEIGALTNDFRSMRDALRSYIDRLRETTAKQQKLESEIQIARGIQMSMVPGGGTVSIREPGYELYSVLRPARSVGGDLYYFKHSSGMLHFIIGDVSDKGVPAALFMAKTVTLYTGALGDALSPGGILARMNQSLAQNNDACMFVTALCGALDLETGRLVMANAGHMHPVQKTAGTSGELMVDGGIALGLTEEAEYPEAVFELAPQTSLLMYTDGISEAFNADGDQYEEQRLLALVGNMKELSAKALGNSTLADVDEFVGSAEQSDDITLMVIHYGQR